jgi:large subunit ribosomal protein L4
MKTIVYNQEGKKMESEMVLPKEIFEVPMNSDLVYQVTVSQISNRRQKVAKTKDRSEVRGGGIKPWRQKGTGRARHGSIRSPLWIGGGVTFGPRLEQNFKKEINRKMRIKALLIVLSSKAKNDMLFVFDELNPPAGGPKTKIMAKLFNKVFLKKGSALIALPQNDANLIKSMRNIENVKVVQARELNALDLLNSKNLILTKDSINIIKKTFLK